MKKFLVLISSLLFFCGFSFAADIPEFILFYWETCPHCKNVEAYFEELKKEYDFKVTWYEVFFDADSQKVMQVYEKILWAHFTWVPVLVAWNEFVEWEDYDAIDALFEKYALKKSENNGNTNDNSDNQQLQRPDKSDATWDVEIDITPLQDVPTISESLSWDEQSSWAVTTTWVDENINALSWSDELTWDVDQSVTLFGKKITLKSVWPIVFWIILWFADGINPCMFWVLIFLLTYLVSVWSKKKVLYSWLIFVITTFILYYGIMYLMHNLLFSTMVLLPYIAYIKYAIWIIAIILWLIEIKDFWFYGQWISLKIPNSIKPTLEYITKKWTYMSAFILAVLSTLVELPCTIWIPLAYIWAVWDNVNIFLALWIYNLFFIIPLLIIVFWIYWWLSMFKTDENGNMTINNTSSKKIMRLVAGIILVVLWILFLTKVL